MSAGVRAASPTAQIGVNNGGWLHWAWFEMLLGDKLDIDFIAYHWQLTSPAIETQHSFCILQTTYCL